MGVAYESDADQVTHVLQEIVETEPLVLKTPPPTVVFEAFGDSALQFSIRAYVRDVEDRLPAIHALHSTIARRFREEQIEIAFPQMDIHVRSPAPESRDASAQTPTSGRHSGGVKPPPRRGGRTLLRPRVPAVVTREGPNGFCLDIVRRTSRQTSSPSTVMLTRYRTPHRALYLGDRAP